MTGYAVMVGLGIVAAAIAARIQPDSVALPAHLRSALALAALGGAIFGAYGLELPADLLGWNAPAPADAGPDVPLGGRTVVGGLIGGWIAVEFVKSRVGIRNPTGDGFALPLAIALTFGRIGCVLAGCCAGVECAPGPFAMHDAAGIARVPVQWIEVGFHLTSALALLWAAISGRASGRRLAIYLTWYAALRFGLEFVRLHPPVMLGLTWYQLLAAVLAAIAGTTWYRRAP